ncbi:MAG TPA: acetyl-CoA carboxylase biotin carboxylase subunit [Bryobacteraceae bacterium]|nr:acetyl-CoA carboxylase biotin carboxylase subunit [Bryobacteraceae bacterium]
MFGKVLVANRGEIAVRVIRALREAGVRSVAVYSEADRASLAVQMADEAVYIGPASAAESYLAIDKIVAAARAHGAEAIHPGYGFLSENAEFAEACAAAGVTFIGPPAAAIRTMGSKTAARQLAIAAGAPVVPGTETAVETFAEAKRIAASLGYPVLLKAAAGGGGKGMRRVDREADLEAALRDASSEAARAFGSGEVYVEKLVAEPRHIEIQVLGDRHGRLIHLGERECSIQRRHQKVLEECPSPLMLEHPELRERMGAAALKIASAAGYCNAGTVEFLVDRERNFYFLEMNTRLQVEHPVTELVTGLDLVQWQLKIAAGEPLTVRQGDVRPDVRPVVQWNGAAIECRIYAEDPDHQFLPSPGKITRLREPSGPGVRVDSGVYEGWNVPVEYDPLLAKLAVWAPSRELAIARMHRALQEYEIGGIRTNREFFADILEDRDFRSGRLSTAFLDGFFERRGGREMDIEMEAVAALVAAMAAKDEAQRFAPATTEAQKSAWLEAGRSSELR